MVGRVSSERLKTELKEMLGKQGAVTLREIYGKFPARKRASFVRKLEEFGFRVIFLHLGGQAGYGEYLFLSQPLKGRERWVVFKNWAGFLKWFETLLKPEVFQSPILMRSLGARLHRIGVPKDVIHAWKEMKGFVPAAVSAVIWVTQDIREEILKLQKELKLPSQGSVIAMLLEYWEETHLPE